MGTTTGKRGWRAFFDRLTASERRDLRDILLEDYAAEIDTAEQVHRHARRLHWHEEHRQRLLAIAAREAEHARWQREAIEGLGGHVPDLVPVPEDADTNWERLMVDRQAEREAYEKFLGDAYELERDHPEIARLLLRISEEEAAHQREIAELLARSDRVALDSKP